MPKIKTGLFDSEDIDGDLISQHEVERSNTVGTQSHSYTRIPGMVVQPEPPIECDAMIFFSGSFRQTEELIGYENMHTAIFVDGNLEKQIEVAPYAWMEDQDGWPYIWSTTVNGTIFWGVKNLSPVQHTIDVRYKVPDAGISGTKLNCMHRHLNVILFHR